MAGVEARKVSRNDVFACSDEALIFAGTAIRAWFRTDFEP